MTDLNRTIRMNGSASQAQVDHLCSLMNRHGLDADWLISQAKTGWQGLGGKKSFTSANVSALIDTARGWSKIEQGSAEYHEVCDELFGVNR